MAFRDRVAEGVDRPAQVPHPGRFLANAYIFGCHGNITQWEAYTFDSGSHPIEFHVWRANETIADVFHLVGNNTFQGAQPDTNHLISFSVPPEEQITVSPGDFVGIRTVMSEQAGFNSTMEECTDSISEVFHLTKQFLLSNYDLSLVVHSSQLVPAAVLLSEQLLKVNLLILLRSS